MLESLVSDIEEATHVLEGVAHRTPLIRSLTFSRMSGCDFYLKLENLQKTGAFKVRGAYYALWKKLRESEVTRCITASSGNHAQGVAFAASQLGIEATVVMPIYTPYYKVQSVRGYGAKVVLEGETYDDAYEKAQELARGGAVFVHPFDDPAVIAGQGTVGVEIAEDLPDVDIVVVPVGGGGLISGIAATLKLASGKNVRVVGVQPKGAAAMCRSYRERRICLVEKPQTIADAVMVKRPGELTFKLVTELVDDMVTVDDSEVARAMFLLLERAKLIAEPAGALAVAALLSGAVNADRKKAVAVVSGGNVDASLLMDVIERGLYLESRHARIRGLLLDRPGQLKKVVDVIAERRINIVHIEHERGNPLITPGYAKVTIWVEIPDARTAEELVEELRKRGLEFEVVPPHE